MPHAVLRPDGTFKPAGATKFSFKHVMEQMSLYRIPHKCHRFFFFLKSQTCCASKFKSPAGLPEDPRDGPEHCALVGQADRQPGPDPRQMRLQEEQDGLQGGGGGGWGRKGHFINFKTTQFTEVIEGWRRSDFFLSLSPLHSETPCCTPVFFPGAPRRAPAAPPARTPVATSSGTRRRPPPKGRPGAAGGAPGDGRDRRGTRGPSARRDTSAGTSFFFLLRDCCVTLFIWGGNWNGCVLSVILYRTAFVLPDGTFKPTRATNSALDM